MSRQRLMCSPNSWLRAKSINNCGSFQYLVVLSSFGCFLLGSWRRVAKVDAAKANVLNGQLVGSKVKGNHVGQKLKLQGGAEEVHPPLLEENKTNFPQSLFCIFYPRINSSQDFEMQTFLSMVDLESGTKNRNGIARGR